MSQPGSESNPLRVAVIGSGPAGFYTVQPLFKGDRTVRVDMFDSLPTPFGLVRFGVAPDHQKIKSVVAVYHKLASDPRFRFFGNVSFGDDIDLEFLGHIAAMKPYPISMPGALRKFNCLRAGALVEIRLLADLAHGPVSPVV